MKKILAALLVAVALFSVLAVVASAEDVSVPYVVQGGGTDGIIIDGIYDSTYKDLKNYGSFKATLAKLVNTDYPDNTALTDLPEKGIVTILACNSNELYVCCQVKDADIVSGDALIFTFDFGVYGKEVVTLDVYSNTCTKVSSENSRVNALSGAAMAITNNKGKVTGYTGEIRLTMNPMHRLHAGSTFNYQTVVINGSAEDGVEAFIQGNVTSTANTFTCSIPEKDDVADARFGSGTGTETDPYIIQDAEQLTVFHDLLLADKENVSTSCFKLAKDIDYKGKSWKTPALTDKSYNGVFDGDGHTISNVVIDESSADYYAGFFGVIGAGGYIKNLTLSNITLNVNGGFNLMAFAGGFAAENKGLIENCIVTGLNATVSANVNGVALGAVCGTGDGSIEKCKVLESNLTVEATSKTYLLASVCGAADIQITDCSVENVVLTPSTTLIESTVLSYVGAGDEASQNIKNTVYTNVTLNGTAKSGKINVASDTTVEITTAETTASPDTTDNSGKNNTKTADNLVFFGVAALLAVGATLLVVKKKSRV